LWEEGRSESVRSAQREVLERVETFEERISEFEVKLDQIREEKGGFVRRRNILDLSLRRRTRKSKICNSASPEYTAAPPTGLIPAEY